jgi:hypothetical protein
MYDAVNPPSGPRTRMPSASSSAWYFHVFGAGSQRQRGVVAAWGGSCAGIGIALMDGQPSGDLDEGKPPS